ncbi:DUF5677 domain-containing protein [Rheinheimera baltica]|uniref:DUF5677 domain-containing protein n=1 Tax=Rheinheimera baltica TaxID=67576 RepID=UPI00273FF0A5|nr:DUF5677 domain-containing protein [Rheinheimera baltica]MDP5190892.1 DUF5677 domain-containing protein [Rheinheimera baltica]
MTDFNEKGFIALNYDQNFAHFRNFHPELTDAFLAFSSIAWQTQYELEVSFSSLEMIYAASLYARILNFTQSAHILSVYGLEVQSSTQCRCALECLFYLAALNKKPQILEQVIMGDTRSAKTYIKLYKEFVAKKNTCTPEKIDNFNATIEALENRIELLKNLGATEIKVENAAKIAEMTEWYDLIYRPMCSSVHSKLHSLEEHLVLGDNKSLENLKNEPSFKNTASILYSCIKISLRAVEEVYIATCEPLPAQIKEFNAALHKLGFEEYLYIH